MRKVHMESNLDPSRRAMLSTLIAVAGTALFPQSDPSAQVTGSAPRPFRVGIPQPKIDRILTRVREAEWPDRLDASDLRYGVSWDYMRALADTGQEILTGANRRLTSIDILSFSRELRATIFISIT